MKKELIRNEIGNDIVDLSLPGTKNKQKDLRFLKRVFTEKEQDFIKNAADPSTTLWCIWAAKEASYKACQKVKNELIFSPQAFIMLDEITMTHEDTKIHLQVEYLKNQYIHCIAMFHLRPVTKEIAFTASELSYADQSRLTRELAKKIFLTQYPETQGRLDIIRKNSRMPPAFYVNGKKLDHELSLSHDDHWLSAVIA